MLTYEIITDPKVMQTREDILDLVSQANPLVDRAAYLESLPGRVAETRFAYIVQYDDGKLTAFAGVSSAPFFHLLLIDNIVVSQTERKRGYGSALLQKVREFGKENGFSKIFLYTQSATAQRGSTLFYARNGFPITGFGLIGSVDSAPACSELRRLRSHIDAQEEARLALTNSIQTLEKKRDNTAAQLIQTFWRRHHRAAEEKKRQSREIASDCRRVCKK